MSDRTEPASDPRRRRRPRRAIGGTVPPDRAGSPEPAGPSGSSGSGSGAPGTSDVLGGSADDSDTGWGETPGGDDERLRREVPPHW